MLIVVTEQDFRGGQLLGLVSQLCDTRTRVSVALLASPLWSQVGSHFQRFCVLDEGRQGEEPLAVYFPFFRKPEIVLDPLAVLLSISGARPLVSEEAGGMGTLFP